MERWVAALQRDGDDVVVDVRTRTGAPVRDAGLAVVVVDVAGAPVQRWSAGELSSGASRYVLPCPVPGAAGVEIRWSDATGEQLLGTLELPSTAC